MTGGQTQASEASCKLTMRLHHRRNRGSSFCLRALQHAPMFPHILRSKRSALRSAALPAQLARQRHTLFLPDILASSSCAFNRDPMIMCLDSPEPCRGSMPATVATCVFHNIRSVRYGSVSAKISQNSVSHPTRSQSLSRSPAPTRHPSAERVCQGGASDALESLLNQGRHAQPRNMSAQAKLSQLTRLCNSVHARVCAKFRRHHTAHRSERYRHCTSASSCRRCRYE